MDPLSVTASIIGILAAGAKVVEVLGPIPAALSGAQSRFNAISTEVSTCMTILSALQDLLTNIGSISSQRRDLIQLDYLITVFTNGVLLFSELESLVVRVDPGNGSVTRKFKSLYHEKDLDFLLTRVQWFKSSMSLLLNILQCDSTADAFIHQQALSSTVDNILQNNDDLTSRLARIEHYLLSSHILRPARPASTIGTAHEDLTGLIGAPSGQRISPLTNTVSLQKFSFEHDLEASRPYRNVKRDTVDYSVRSSVVNSHAWSALSDISLSEISVLGVIRLPITSSEISNSHHYTHQDPLADSRMPRQSRTPTTPEIDWARYFAQGSLEISRGASLEISQGASLAITADVGISRGDPFLSPMNSQSISGEGPWNGHAIPTIAVSPDGEFPAPLTARLASQRLVVPVQQIVVFGGAGTGKNDFRIEFLRSHYGDEYDPTAEDSYQKTCMVDDELARLDILDTAGQEYYRSITEQYMQTGDGFLLVFSVTSLESLKEVVSFMHQIQQAKGKAYFPIVVVGNHCTRESKREVSYREGRSLAESFGYAYIEADATNGVNVQQAFFEIVREIRRYDKFKTWMAQQSLAKGRGFEATRDTTQLHTGIVRRADERTFWRRARRGPSMEMINEDS